MLFEAIRRWFLRLLGRGRKRRARDQAAGRRRRRRARAQRPSTALGTFGTRMGHHAGIYGGGQGASLLLGLVTLAILTRFLEPAQFGEYALYYVFATMLSIVYTLGWVRGSLLWVFGGRGDDEDDDDEDEDDGSDDAEPIDEQTAAKDKRTALGTAIVLLALIGAVGTAVVALWASTAADILTGDASEGRLAVLAGVAGATGAVWILASAVPRRERRPKTFVLANLSRPALVLAATVPLVAVEPDVDNAVLGLLIGSFAAMLVTLLAIRHSFRLALKGSDVRRIARGGIRYAPLILSLFVISQGGVLLLGQYEAQSEVGLFRVAAGVAALASLPMGAFVTAWGPLRREPIYGAVEAERGKLAASGILATYFVLAAIGVLLTLAVGADLLVRVAPGSYADAAPLIPIVGLSLLLHGLLRVTRRSAKFPNRSNWYIALAVGAAIVFVGACLLLIPALGTDGAALAGVSAFLFAVTVMLARSQLGDQPIPFEYGRLLGGLAIGGACYAVALLLDGVAGSLAPLVDVAAIIAYPVLLVVTGIVPRAHLLPLQRVATAAVPGRSPALNGRVELNTLDEVQRAMLEVLIRHRRPVSEVAPLIHAPSDALEASFVEALRQVAGVEPSRAADPRIGAYLLSSAPVAARDKTWRRLAAEGADALEVDALTLTLERLRRAPEATWRGR